MTIPPNCPDDNCAACLNGPTRPHTTRSDGKSIVGAYRCRECGETWTTSWLIEALAREEINHDVA